MSAYHWQGRKSGHAFLIVCLGCPSRPARLVPRRLPRACRAAVQIIVERPIRPREDRSDGIGEASRADRQGAFAGLTDQGARPDGPPALGAGGVLAAISKRKYSNPKGMVGSADHARDAVWTHRPYDRAGIGFDAGLCFEGFDQPSTPGHVGSRERGGSRSLQIGINLNETALPGVTEIKPNSHVSLHQGGLSDLLRTVLRRVLSGTRLWYSRLNPINCAGVTVRRGQSVILRAIEEAAVGRERGNAKLSEREGPFANKVKLLCKHGPVRTEFRVL